MSAAIHKEGHASRFFVPDEAIVLSFSRNTIDSFHSQIGNQDQQPAEIRLGSLVSAMRNEVAAPLFAAASASEFHDLLPDLLTRGAIIRLRVLNLLAMMPELERSPILADWVTPLSAPLLRSYQQRASRFMGAERSFQIQRALTRVSSYGDIGPARLPLPWEEMKDIPNILVEKAVLEEAKASADVLLLAWMMLLQDEFPNPPDDVADEAAKALLQAVADRLEVEQTVLRGELASESFAQVDACSVTPDWMDQHQELSWPVQLLLGFALSDKATGRVVLGYAEDPDEEGVSFLRIRLFVADGHPYEAELRLEARALRSGALGVLVDDTGTEIAISSASGEGL